MAIVPSKPWRDAVVLVALGIGAFAVWPCGTTALFGSAIVGAGLFMPFGRPRLGANVGAMLLVAIPVIVLLVMAILGKLE